MVAAMAGRRYGFLQRCAQSAREVEERNGAWKTGRFVSCQQPLPASTYWGTAGRHRPNPAKRRQRRQHSHGAAIASDSRPRAVFRRGESDLGLVPASLVRLRSTAGWLRSEMPHAVGFGKFPPFAHVDLRCRWGSGCDVWTR
jgi:hypothetical protein